MRALFATTVIPFAEASGGERISSAVLQVMKRLGCEVVVAGYSRRGAPPLPERDAVVVGRRGVESADAPLSAIFWMARAVATGAPYTAAKVASKRYGALVRRMIKSGRIDAVVLDHTQLAWLLDFIPVEMPTAVLMHNAESELYELGSASQGSPVARYVYRREARYLEVLERHIGERAHRIWALTEHDREILLERTVAPVTVIPVGFRPTDRSSATEDPTVDVGLLGTWSWHPNRDGLRWFLTEVLPRLPDDLSVHVAGGGGERLCRGCVGVTYRGHVEDADSFMRSCRVFAVPTRFGTGVETKMLAAIAAGCAIVGTSASARGLRPLPASVALSDDAESFANRLSERARSGISAGEREGARLWCERRTAEFRRVLGSELALLREGPEPSLRGRGESGPQVKSRGRS